MDAFCLERRTMLRKCIVNPEQKCYGRCRRMKDRVAYWLLPQPPQLLVLEWGLALVRKRLFPLFLQLVAFATS